MSTTDISADPYAPLMPNPHSWENWAMAHGWMIVLVLALLIMTIFIVCFAEMRDPFIAIFNILVAIPIYEWVKGHSYALAPLFLVAPLLFLFAAKRRVRSHGPKVRTFLTCKTQEV